VTFIAKTKASFLSLVAKTNLPKKLIPKTFIQIYKINQSSKPNEVCRPQLGNRGRKMVPVNTERIGNIPNPTVNM
jgi:hypothetical protein